MQQNPFVYASSWSNIWSKCQTPERKGFKHNIVNHIRNEKSEAERQLGVGCCYPYRVPCLLFLAVQHTLRFSWLLLPRKVKFETLRILMLMWQQSIYKFNHSQRCYYLFSQEFAFNKLSHLHVVILFSHLRENADIKYISTASKLEQHEKQKCESYKDKTLPCASGVTFHLLASQGIKRAPLLKI